MDSSLKILVADRVRMLREKDSRNKASMAKVLGVSERSYCYYESGHCSFNLSFLVRVADYFGVTVDYLLGLSDDPKGYKYPEAITYVPVSGSIFARGNID